MKICFVGAGSIGKRHIRNLSALSDESGFSLEIHLLRSSHKELEKDVKDMVSREWYSVSDITEVYDAVFITNPTYLHYSTLLELKSKSHFFFIEKPVFDNWNVDLEPFSDNNVYYVACPLRYTKVIQKAKEVVNDNKVLSVRAISSSYLPDWRSGIDYRNTYSAHREQGGGVKIDLIHEWDYLTYLFGFPNYVSHLEGKFSNLEIDSEDMAVYIAEYCDKLVELHLDYFGKQVRRDCEIITNDDVFKFDIANNCILKNGILYEKYEEHPNDKYIEEMQFFLRLLRGEVQNINDMCHAIETIRIACNNYSANQI